MAFAPLLFFLDLSLFLTIIERYFSNVLELENIIERLKIKPFFQQTNHFKRMSTWSMEFKSYSAETLGVV